MNLIKCYQTTSDWYKGARRGSTPVGILWHDTAGGNPYLKRYVQPSDDATDKAEMLELLGKNKYNNDWNHSSREAGLNAWIGKLADGSMATIQAGEWDIHPWGCGGGSKGSCNGYIKKDGSSAWVNQHWIQFEICDDGYGSEDYFQVAYKEACEFTAHICKTFGIDPNGTVEFNGVQVPTILCHADSYKLGLGGNHGDIYSWFNRYGYDMNNVRADVAALLGQENKVVETTHDFHILDQVKIRDGVTTYYNGKGMASWVPKSTLYVRNVDGNKVTVSTLTEGAVTGTVFNTDLVLVKCVKESGGEKEPVVMPEGYSSTGCEADLKKMWDSFVATFDGNEFAAAGMMGNIYAESSFRSNNLQQTYERKLGYTDDSYSDVVDSGEYTEDKFVHDSAGYGLCQWTYYTRKQAMYDFHKAANKSIRDFETQLALIKHEISNKPFKKLYEQLIASTSVREASDLILINFEAPASCNEEATQVKRAGYSQKYYDMFATLRVEEAPAEETNSTKEDVDKQPVEEVPVETLEGVTSESPVESIPEQPIEKPTEVPEENTTVDDAEVVIPEDPADSIDDTQDAVVEDEPKDAEEEIDKQAVNSLFNILIKFFQMIIGLFKKK